MELAAAPEVWGWGRASAMVTQAASSKSHRQGPLGDRWGATDKPHQEGWRRGTGQAWGRGWGLDTCP